MENNLGSLGGSQPPIQSGNSSPHFSIRTPSPQPTLSYAEMKSALMDYDILRPGDIPIKDDEARSVYIFKQDGITKVLKMGNKAVRDDTTKYKLLKKEYSIYQQLDSLPPATRSYFPALYDGGDIGGIFFLLIEYVDGHVLTDYIEQGIQSPPPVKILIDLAKALEALRSISLVHGDLSTENIIVTQDSIKLIDFERTGSLDIRLNVRGSEQFQIGFLYIMSTLLPRGDVYTSLEEEIRTCNDCSGFYASAIRQLSRQGGGVRKIKRGNKTKKARKASAKKSQRFTRLNSKGVALPSTRVKRN